MACSPCRCSSAAAGAVLAQRAYRVTAYDSAALRGFGSGFGAAVLLTAAASRWPAARWAPAGWPTSAPRWARCCVAAVAAMSLGGLVAGVVTAWWQRRGAA